MPPKKPYRSSALTDNVRPGAPTTMDVLMRWITKPGNVRRWRMGPRPPLMREVVDMMQKEGLVHRQAPFVRYKLDAIEKQYITAKQWLLETGMHDAYMRGKATKEVRANVDRVCPQFRTLDPAFRGVPFNKKNVETIELDDESTEDVETEEKGGESEEEEWEEEEENKKVEEKTAPPVDLQKKNTFRDRLFPGKDNVEKEKTSMSNEDRQKKAQIFRDRLFAQKENVAEKEKVSTAEPQQEKGNTVNEQVFTEKDNTAQKKASPSPTTKKKTSLLVRRLASSSGYAAAEKVRSTTTTGPQEEPTVSRDQLLSSASNVAGKRKVSTPVESKKKRSTQEQLLTAAVQVAMEQAAPEAAKSAPAPAPKKRERPPKSLAIVPPTSNGAKGTTQAANDKNATALKTKAVKRKNSGEETNTSEVKRTRTQVQDETEREDFVEIERMALLKRVNDEEKQRQEMYKLERAKLECELESKQVQLLFEKAAARKKLDQLGVSEEEIDRILPL